MGRTFDFESQVFGDLLQTLVRDRRQDRRRRGGDIGVVFDTKEISGTAFVDVFLFFGVQIEFAGIAVVVCPFVGAQAGGIVASHLERPVP